MSKKILILTGSPRPDSKTVKLAKAFAESAEKNGNEIVWFDAGRKKLQGCVGCNACWSKGTACAVDPGFQELASAYESCDSILIATPLYWFGFPAQLKAAIDKLYPYSEGAIRPLKIKESFLIVSGADNSDEDYLPIKDTYQMIASYVGWTDKGILQAGGIEEKGALEDSGFLDKARSMGQSV